MRGENLIFAKKSPERRLIGGADRISGGASNYAQQLITAMKTPHIQTIFILFARKDFCHSRR